MFSASPLEAEVAAEVPEVAFVPTCDITESGRMIVPAPLEGSMPVD
jgi:hypothetical protein